MDQDTFFQNGEWVFFVFCCILGITFWRIITTIQLTSHLKKFKLFSSKCEKHIWLICCLYLGSFFMLLPHFEKYVTIILVKAYPQLSYKVYSIVVVCFVTMFSIITVMILVLKILWSIYWEIINHQKLHFLMQWTMILKLP